MWRQQRGLFPAAAIVLLAHAALLTHVPALQGGGGGEPRVPVFQTRMIEFLPHADGAPAAPHAAADAFAPAEPARSAVVPQPERLPQAHQAAARSPARG